MQDDTVMSPGLGTWAPLPPRILPQSLEPTPPPSLALTEDGPREHARPGTRRGQALIGREGRGPLGDKAPTQQVSSRNKRQPGLKPQRRGVSTIGFSWEGKG